MDHVAPGSAPSHRLRNFLLIVAVWTIIGLFYFSQSFVQSQLRHDPSPWWYGLVSWLVGVWCAALSTPLILWLGRRFPLTRKRWLSGALAHLAFSFTLSLLQIAVMAMTLSALHIYHEVMPSAGAAFVVLMSLGFHQNVITYATLLALQAGWTYYVGYQERQRAAAQLELRAAELQAQLVHAQLGALKAQLQPHFLFNTLNAIVTLVRQGQSEQAEQMLGRLADLLRLVLDELNAQLVPVHREIAYARLYLSIEEVRFGDRLRVEFETQPGVLEAQVPHLCLQPLIENAVRHGIARRAGPGSIVIRAAREADALVLRVEDDGAGLGVQGAERPGGIGLTNVRDRLARLYGPEASLELRAATPHGVVATICLPYRESSGVTPTEDL